MTKINKLFGLLIWRLHRSQIIRTLNKLKGVRNELARLWEEESPFVTEWLERHNRYGLSINNIECPHREAEENN